MTISYALAIVIGAAATVWILLALPLIYAWLVNRIALRRASQFAIEQARLPDPELTDGLRREAAPFGPSPMVREIERIQAEINAEHPEHRPTPFARRLYGINGAKR